MTDPSLRPAIHEEITQSLAFAALPRAAHDSDDVMARIAAERLVQHLEESGFVLMKRPDLKAHSVP